MSRRRDVRQSFAASIVIGKPSRRRRTFVWVVRRSASFAKVVLLTRVLRRLFGAPPDKSLNVRTSRAVIDLKGK